MKPFTHELYVSGRLVKRYTSGRAAYRAADRIDAEYGAVICSVRPIPVDEAIGESLRRDRDRVLVSGDPNFGEEL